MLLVGDGWAEDHHDVEVQDRSGRKLAAVNLPEGVTGIARLHELVARHGGADLDRPRSWSGSRLTAARGYRL